MWEEGGSPRPHKKNIPKSKLGDLPSILLFLCQILSSIKGILPYDEILTDYNKNESTGSLPLMLDRI